MSHVIGAQVTEDLLAEIDEFREEGESRSEALRRLVRDGLEEERQPYGFSGPYALLLFGVAILSARYVEIESAGAGWLGAAAVIIALALSTDEVRSFIAQRSA